MLVRLVQTQLVSTSYLCWQNYSPLHDTRMTYFSWKIYDLLLDRKGEVREPFLHLLFLGCLHLKINCLHLKKINRSMGSKRVQHDTHMQINMPMCQPKVYVGWCVLMPFDSGHTQQTRRQQWAAAWSKTLTPWLGIKPWSLVVRTTSPNHLAIG